MDWGDVRTVGERSTERGDPTRDLSGWSLPVLLEWEMAPENPGAASGNARSLFFSDFVEAD